MVAGATFDTSSEPGAYADALRFVPWIEDRDGHTFYTIAFLNPPATLQSVLDAGEDGGKPDACRVIPDDFNLHSPTDTDEGQHDVI